MRVLIESLEYPPNVYGGVGIHVYNLAHHLCQMGVQVEVICQDGTTGFGQHFPELPIVVHRLTMRERMFPLNWLSFSEKVNQFLREKGTDYNLVHEHLGVVTQCPVPLVCTLHSLVKREIVEEGCERMPLIKSVVELESHSLAASSGLIGVSQQVIDSVHREYSYTRKIRKIFNGLDVNLFRRLPLTRIFDVAFVGRFTKSKGIDHLLEALSKLESGGCACRCFSVEWRVAWEKTFRSGYVQLATTYFSPWTDHTWTCPASIIAAIS